MKTIEQAMKKLKRIKVGELYYQELARPKEDGGYYQQFDRDWWMVLHELDMYNEGEYDVEDEDFDHLTERTAKTTRKWLEDTQHLTIEFKDVKF